MFRYAIKRIVVPTMNEIIASEESETCSPNSLPIVIIPRAQRSDEKKNNIPVATSLVFASPASIGMNALIEGVIFPKNIYHIPRLENVS